MAGRREEGWSPGGGASRPLSPPAGGRQWGEGWVEEGGRRSVPSPLPSLSEGMWHPPGQNSGNVRPGFSLREIRGGQREELK